MQLGEIKKAAADKSGSVSSNESELQRLYTAITGAKGFSYDPRNDSAFKSYADTYMKNGRLAMADAMGTAAGLTGGYGSSYAQSVGAQQYEKYLQALSSAMPEFYSLALSRYNSELENLKDQYDMVNDAEKQAYERSRDEKSDASKQEQLEYDRAQDEYEKAQDAYARLVKLVSTAGYEPSDGELSAAGLKREQAEALIAQYRLENGLSSSGASVSATKKKTLTRADLPMKYILGLA